MKAFLEQWQDRATFARVVASESHKLNSERYWGSKQKWLREAFIANKLASAARSARVRIGQEARGQPDSELMLRTGSILRFQHIEADRPGRQRHREYKEWAAAGYPQRAELWDVEADRAAFPLAIRIAAENKANKARDGFYANDTSLLIDVNLGHPGIRRSDLEAELVENSKIAHPLFRSVWAWWSGRLYRCWPNPSIGPLGVWRPEPIALGWSKHHTPLSKLLD